MEGWYERYSKYYVEVEHGEWVTIGWRSSGCFICTLRRRCSLEMRFVYLALKLLPSRPVGVTLEQVVQETGLEMDVALRAARELETAEGMIYQTENESTWCVIEWVVDVPGVCIG